MDSPRSSAPTCSTTVGRGNADGGDGGSDYDEDYDDDDDGILNGQSQIIRADMLYDCGER